MDMDIAVIGMAGRFPCAKNIHSFYENLKQGIDCVREISETRKCSTALDLDAQHRLMGYLDRIDTFDAGFFGISPAEAVVMDPHQRLMLEVAYEAFESAGLTMEDLKGSNTAVFIGDTDSSYHELVVEDDPTFITGNANAVLAGRIARFFGLTGNALMIDTACSSSLVAVHMGCQELRLTECDQVIVGAANLSVAFPEIDLTDGVGIMSEDGKSKPFSNDANGTGIGEAVACVVLKPLEPALKDNDEILAIIKGSAVNQEGHRSSSLTAPSSSAQAEVIKKAWKTAGVDPSTIDLIETHGTGTQLGDPIEVDGISEAFRQFTSKKQFCALSAVKSNTGHTDTVAGITGLIKVILSLRNKEIFPSLHFSEPNEFINFLNSPVYVNTELRSWPQADHPRRAGVSSFGISGTNCHVVLEEAAHSNEIDKAFGEEYLLPVSSKTITGLERNLQVLMGFLLNNSPIKIEDVAHTLSLGRTHYPARRIYRSSSLVEFTKAISIDLSNPQSLKARKKLETWLIFSSDPKISDTLIDHYRSEYPVFGAAIDECKLLEDSMDDFHNVDCSSCCDKCRLQKNNTINKDSYNRFVFQYAAFRLLQSFGLASKQMIGLGTGRVLVDYLKNDISLHDALMKAAKMPSTREKDLRERVSKFVESKLNKKQALLIEFSPNGNISKTIREITNGTQEIHYLGSEKKQIIDLVSALYVNGCKVNWQNWQLNKPGKKIQLPGYQFLKSPYWLKSINNPGNKHLSTIKKWFYELTWMENSIAEHGSVPTGKIFLVIGKLEKATGKIISCLLEAKNTCIEVEVGSENVSTGNNKYRVTGNEIGCQWLKEQLDTNGFSIDGILYANVHRSTTSASKAIGEDGIIGSIYFPYWFFKTFHEELGRRNFMLFHLTKNAQNFQNENISVFDHATMAFIKGLLSEYTQLDLKSIDLDNTSDPGLNAELFCNDVHRFIVYRHNKRYVSRLSSINPGILAPGKFKVKKAGVYLITGGASGLGYAVAKKICYEQDAQLVILGRSQLPNKSKWSSAVHSNALAINTRRRIKALMDLEEIGSSVDYYSVDVQYREQVEPIIKDILHKYNKIDGVVHSAGLMLFEELATMSFEEYHRTISPKVQGSIILGDLLKSQNLDWFVMFSSLNAIVPQKYTTAYTVGNAFLDAYTCFLQQEGVNAISINWGAWGETGQGQRDIHSEENFNSPLRAWSTAKGLKAFELAFSADIHNVAIGDIREELFLTNPFFKFDEELNEVQKSIPMNSVNLNRSTSEVILDIWVEVLKITSIDLDDNFFDLGGHSLLATRLTNRIEQYLGVPLKFKDILSYPTVRSLAKRINDIRTVKLGAETNQIAAIEEQEYYPVSNNQRRLWIVDQVSKNGDEEYNIPFALSINGQFDVSLVSQAFKDIVARHEILRTTFFSINGEPFQKVHDIQEFTFSVDIIEPTKAYSYDAECKMIDECNAVNFDLQRGPLFSASIIKWSGSKFTCVISMHHIISDGWSLGLLIKEVFETYHNKRKGINKIHQLPIQHKDYSHWQHENLVMNSKDKDRKFWRDQFKGGISPINLPIDYARPPVKTNRGEIISRFDQEIHKIHKKITQKYEASYFMSLLASVNILLYRYSQQESMVIGSVLAGRDHKDLENQIGFFVNTLPFNCSVKGADCFEDIIFRIRDLVLDVYEHQHYPFDNIVGDVQVSHDLSRSPLFDVVVSLINSDLVNDDHTVGGSMSIEPIDYSEKHSKYDLVFIFSPYDSGIKLSINYNTDLFKKDTIDRMLNHYQNLMKEIEQKADQPIRSLNILPAEERHELLHSFNNTAFQFHNEPTLQAQFEHFARITPSAVALVLEDDVVTYEALNTMANSLAHYFKDVLSIGNKDIVAVETTKSKWWLASFLAVLKSGGVYLPVDPTYPLERINYILNDSKAKILLTDRDARIVRANLPVINSRELLSKIDHRSQNLAGLSSADHVAYIIYTSGSTGLPKGVQITHQAYLNTLMDQTKTYQITPIDHVLQFARGTFDASMLEIGLAFCSGAQLVLVQENVILNLAKFYEYLERSGVTWTLLPPSFFQLLDIDKLKSLRTLVTGGEAAGFNKAIQSLGKITYYNAYGPTECSIVSSTHRLTQEDRELGLIPIGKPIKNTKFYILDNNGQLLPKGITGELHISGKGLAEGYLNNPDLTKEKFTDNPYAPGTRMYKTGDLAKWSDNGEVIFVGRTDTQVKLNGYRVELGEVESVLNKIPGLKQSKVVLIEDNQGDPHLTAFYITGVPFSEEELRRHVSDHLPTYMVPSKLLQVEHFPTTAHGKVDVTKLPSPFLSKKDEYNSNPPTGEIEKELAEVWCQILSVESISRDDQFFMRGGDSLKAIKLTNKIKTSFNCDVEVHEIFRFPVLRDLAGLIKKREKSLHVNITPIEEQDHYPLSSAQLRLWIIDQAGIDQYAYNLVTAYSLKGEVDVQALENAFMSLIRRHEALRTRFINLNGRPRQQVLEIDEFEYTLEFFDCSHADRDQIDLEISRETCKILDLKSGRLLRTILIKTGNDHYIFTLVLHHIISDGWSMELIISEVLSAYNSLKSKIEPALNPLRIQYKDYATWNNRRLKEDRFDKIRSYWLERFKAPIAPLELPLDQPRPAEKTLRGGSLKSLLVPGRAQQLYHLLNEKEVSLFMVLVSAVTTLLYRYSLQNDIVIGTVMAGRDHEDLEDQVGFYLNTLPLRVNVDPGGSLNTLLYQVKEVVLGAQSNAGYPLEQLIEQLDIDRKPNRSPLFDVLINLQNVDAGTNHNITLEDIEVSPYASESSTSKFDLTFIFGESDSGVSLVNLYNAHIFNEETIKNIAHHLEVIIDQFILNGNIQVDEIPFDQSTEDSTPNTLVFNFDF